MNTYFDFANESTRTTVDAFGKLAAVNSDVFAKLAQLQLDAASKAFDMSLAQAKRLQSAKSFDDIAQAGQSFVETSMTESLNQAKHAVDFVVEARAAYLGLMAEAQAAATPKPVKKVA